MNSRNGTGFRSSAIRAATSRVAGHSNPSSAPCLNHSQLPSRLMTTPGRRARPYRRPFPSRWRKGEASRPDDLPKGPGPLRSSQRGSASQKLDFWGSSMVATSVAAEAPVDDRLRRKRDFQFLLAGSSVSMLGSRLTAIGLPLLILALTGSPLVAGWAGFAAAVPSILVFLPAGALVDRWNPRRAMIFSELWWGTAIAAVVVTRAAGPSGRGTTDRAGRGRRAALYDADGWASKELMHLARMARDQGSLKSVQSVTDMRNKVQC
jgi:hypothetical protein